MQMKKATPPSSLLLGSASFSAPPKASFGTPFAPRVKLREFRLTGGWAKTSPLEMFLNETVHFLFDGNDFFYFFYFFYFFFLWCCWLWDETKIIKKKFGFVGFAQGGRKQQVFSVFLRFFGFFARFRVCLLVFSRISSRIDKTQW